VHLTTLWVPYVANGQRLSGCDHSSFVQIFSCPFWITATLPQPFQPPPLPTSALSFVKINLALFINREYNLAIYFV